MKKGNQTYMYSLILGICWLIFGSTILRAQEAAAYEVVDEYNYWFVHDQKEAVIFANMAYIREEPSSKSKLVDSLAVGTPIKFIGEDAINRTTIRGMNLPWYRIEYRVNNQVKKGYIWVGLVAIDYKIDKKSGNTFLYGFAWQSFEKDKEGYENSYYWTEAKVLGKQRAVLETKAFAFFPFEESYSQASLQEPDGLSNVLTVFTVTFSGEACGIPTNNFNLAWNGTKLLDLPKTTSVSDAGVYYYSEELQFPKQHKRGKQWIVKLIETGESETELDDETVTEIKYRVSKEEEVFEWDGSSFHKKTT